MTIRHMLANIIDRELLRSWLSLKLLSRLDAHGQKNITIFFWMGQLVNQPVFNKHLLCVSPMLGVSPNIQGIQKKNLCLICLMEMFTLS